MGMSISPVKAEIVFGDEEKYRKGQTRRLVKESWIEPGEDINQVVNGVRYVDDLVLMSGILRGERLQKFVGALYRPPVKFEIEEVGQTLSFVARSWCSNGIGCAGAGRARTRSTRLA